jgi:glycosyltransferase involved in cell wall biosynthesis
MTGAAAPDPLVTIGVISFNRLLYVRALLESARECIDYPNLQWLVVDGDSREPGLRSYLQGLDFLDDLAFVESGDLADSMNRMLELTRGDYLLMVPDRIQFIVRGRWLADLVEVARDHRRVGHVCFDAQRRVTLRRQFGEAYLRVRGRRVALPFVRRPLRRHRTSSGREFLGYGRTMPGVNTGGIAFNRVEIWRQLGPWRTTMAMQLTNDAGLGTETDLLERYRRSGPSLERFLMRQPVAAGIVTDPRGTAAKIRLGNRRYGRYLSPPSGRMYYRIYDEAEADDRFGSLSPAPAFEDIVEPLGFELPLDQDGHLRKVSVIGDDEPYELVVALTPT